ncbi:phosphotransferase enzyme family protein [Agrococcus jejuensis]|uniref:Aminoglycoside phosphotransferase domain-containing protein n=1 Tax=Agrococcus jejuensis TaxID=399736 RepID=A0A1G8GLD2_9MICO|nr:phosphotransferase [Agrococcus jejuensis]SDH95107.1 hypothetical protein SAMN04489720_2980 [Agrococcus jejuensis]
MSVHASVSAAFGTHVTIDGTDSIHAYALVWWARVHGPEGDVPAVVKRTWGSGQHALEAWQRALVARGIRTVEPLLSPVAVQVDGDDEARTERWVAYPRLHGRGWDGSVDDVRAAGRLLGAMHAASADLVVDDFPAFEWGSDAPASIADDVEAVRASAAEHWPSADPAAWIAALRRFPTTLATVRDAALPLMPCSLDHRAANLLFDAEGALTFDLENAALAPRILDLAVAVLLFPLEDAGSAGRSLSRDEWRAFLAAYLERAPRLTSLERDLWPMAVEYMRLEWGTWHLTEGVEPEPANLGYLEDLLTLDGDRYALP